MLKELVDKSYDRLMRDVLNRIKSGKKYDINFKPYDMDMINNMIKYFEEIEEYENCKTLLDFSNKRFNHEINYIKK